MDLHDGLVASLVLTPEGKLKLIFPAGTTSILRKVYVNNRVGCTHCVEFVCSDGTQLNLNYVPE